MLTSGTGKDECNTHVWIWRQTHDRSGKVSNYSQNYSHSTSAENICLGRAAERFHVMQVKETKGRKTDFGLGLRICSGLAPPAHLEGMCTCRSCDQAGLGHVWSLLDNSWASRAPIILPLCQAGFVPSPFSSQAVAGLAVLAQCSRVSATASHFWWPRAEHLCKSLMLEGERKVSEWPLTAWSGAAANCVCSGTCFVMEGCGRLMEESW